MALVRMRTEVRTTNRGRPTAASARELSSVKIWIDGDACPRPVKQIVFRASERLGIPVCVVANADLGVPHSALVSAVRVPHGFDRADK